MELLQQRDSSWWRDFRSNLLKWYDSAHRDLPWRSTHDPYRIWISEIMLQQTQVATVLDYYRRFLEAFPNVDALARAREEDVLALWSGLGYYRRARQLHAAAKVVSEELEGEFPRTLEGVQALPGVGRYTAGAITSFAFDQPSPILEANTIRLFSRLVLMRELPTSSFAQGKLWEFAEQLVQESQQSPAKLNQAAMELGSQICLPSNPKCNECPVASICPTFHAGLQAEIPKPKPKKEFVEESHILVLVRKNEEFLLQQNQAGQWWEGLWDFPRTKMSKRLQGEKRVRSPSEALKRQLANDLRVSFDVEFEIGHWFHSLKHAVTKYKIQLHCYEARVLENPTESDGDRWRWAKAAEIETLPITSSARKILKRIA